MHERDDQNMFFLRPISNIFEYLIILGTGFGEEYLKTSEKDNPRGEKAFLTGYKSVLNSKSNEETLVS